MMNASHSRRAALRLLAALLLALLPASLRAEPAAGGPGKTVRLLTIGNSFSANATHYLGDLAKADGNVLIHRPIVIGGASLELHAGRAQKFEANPEDKAGLYAGGRSLKENLRAERWDFVTIQQASIKSHDVATYRPHAAWLRDYVKQHAPQAELLLHQTWAYRRDDARFAKPPTKPGEPATQAEMYRMLSTAYATIAGELGVRRLPVGDAFYRADTDVTWGFKGGAKFDPKTAREPELPDQTHSLHKGWNWKKGPDGRTTLTMDGHHASTAGEYLGACVWYEVLFGRSVVGNSFIPAGLDADYARFLRETAHAAVEAAKAPAATK